MYRTANTIENVSPPVRTQNSWWGSESHATAGTRRPEVRILISLVETLIRFLLWGRDDIQHHTKIEIMAAERHDTRQTESCCGMQHLQDVDELDLYFGRFQNVTNP